MKLHGVLAVAVIAVLLTSVSTVMIQDKLSIVSVHTYAMDVLVKNVTYMGVNVNPDGLHFGTLQSGMKGNRYVEVNKVQHDIFVTVEKDGEIASWVSNPDRVFLRKGEGTNITFMLVVPENVSYGNHTGTVTLTVRKV